MMERCRESMHLATRRAASFYTPTTAWQEIFSTSWDHDALHIRPQNSPVSMVYCALRDALSFLKLQAWCGLLRGGSDAGTRRCSIEEQPIGHVGADWFDLGLQAFLYSIPI